MGAITGLLGLNGGANGTGFAGPQGAAIVNPTSQDQIQGAYRTQQDALAEQKALLAALQGQNGIGNQSQVYGQLQNVVGGSGPNPAQSMLNQATGQNVSNQAALMAGQRGAGSNVGLIARQAAQQGAATQQNAVGQGATMQANQSLNALNSAGNIANTQVANQIGATTANTGAQQAEQQQLLNAQAQANNANVGMQSNINTGNAALANTTMQGQQGLIGGAMQGAGAAFGVPAASGGDVTELKKMAEGGATPIPVGAPLATQSKAAAPQSAFVKFLHGLGGGSSENAGSLENSSAPQSGANALRQGMASMVGAAAKPKPKTPSIALSPAVMLAASGGTVPAMVSPGEKYLPPKDVEKVKRGANPMKVGETIPGKPNVAGAQNSYANDTVKKNLKEGGIIVPRSETKSEDPEHNSANFVAAILAKRKARA